MARALAMVPDFPVVVLQKLATAVAFCKKGRGLIKVNGCPIELLEPGSQSFSLPCVCG